MRLSHLALAAALPASLLGPGCETGPGGGDIQTTVVRTLVTLPGEDELLRMEEERWSGDGRLKRYLIDTNPKVRRRAVLALGRIGDRTLLPELKRLLADKDAGVRAQAALAAGTLGDLGVAAELDLLLADPEPAVRSNALLARGLLGGESVPEALRRALAPEPADATARAVLGQACLAAARFNDPSLAPALAALLGHEDAEIRWRAAYALYRLGQEGPALLAALDDADPRVRCYAALGTGAAKLTEAVPALVERLGDGSTDVASAAASALGSLGATAAAPALVELVRSAAPRRRHAAISALAAGAGTAEALLGLLDDPNPHARAAAVDGLRRLKAGRAAVARAARDPDWRVRAAAARALADFGDSQTLAQTMQYDADARVVPPVLEGLARLGYRSLDTVLLKHLTDKDPIVRATAARLLGGRHIETGTDMLIRSWELSKLDDVLAAKLAILEALAREGGTEKVLAHLKLAAHDSSLLVRGRAWALLERLNATEGVEPPPRLPSLKTDNYYRDLVSRGDFEFHARIETEAGPLTFRLYPREAALSVRFLDEVVTAGYFDDRTFTSADLPFEIGDGDDRGDGHGHYAALAPDEPHDVPFTKVHLTLARPLGRDSGNSQFRITLVPRPDLDGVATNLGELTQGAEILDQLAPGVAIRSVTIAAGEFKGKYVEQRVAVRRDDPRGPEAAAAAALAAGGGAPGAWQRPPVLLYLAIIAGVMLALALLPLLVSAEKREDFPLALGIVLLLILAVAGIYTYLVMGGDYFTLLTSERPGPRLQGKPNPPIMAADQAELACIGAMGWVVLELAFLWFLVSGRSFARWLFLFLALVEIALFTAQISTKLPLLYVLSQVGIGANLFKIWFLLMDRQTKEYLAS